MVSVYMLTIDSIRSIEHSNRPVPCNVMFTVFLMTKGSTYNTVDKGEGMGHRGHAPYTYKTPLTMRPIFSKTWLFSQSSLTTE